ncbi:SGNH/GDSL hydrolase family protein [Rhodoglobus sp. NPDC076762]
MDPKNTPPERANGISPHTPLMRRLIAGVIHLFRPLLKVNLLAYRADSANALFPAGIPAGEVSAPEPLRLLFLGDSAASSYGVLNHGLGVVSQTARYTARQLTAGCSWTTITDTELTMARAAEELRQADLNVDIVVVILGPPDVLLGTTATEWAAKLRTIIHTARQGPNPNCPVVIAAVPPMYRFRAMPRFVQRLLALQITRLNRASLVVAETVPGVHYSVFPSLRTPAEFIQDSFNWKRVHALWGKQLGATTALALDERRNAHNGA